MSVASFVIVILILVPLMLLQMFIPYFTRETISFGISVSEEMYYSSPVKAMRKAYALISGIFYGIIILLLLLTAIYGTEDWISLEIPFLVLALILLSYGLYLYFYTRMKKLKASLLPEQPGRKPLLPIDTSFRQQRLALSNHWFWVHFAVILGCLVFTLAKYNQIPSLIPTHYDLHGNADAYSEKSYRTVLLPNILQLGMVLLMLFVNWTIVKSKQQLSPSNPKKSARNNALFRRRWSFFTILAALALVFLFFFIQLTMIYKVEGTWIAVVSLLIPLLVVAGAVWLSFTTGQGGSRIGRKERADAPDGGESAALPVNDDKDWKLGGIYFNRLDPAIFVEKRTGIGWTLNFAHPLSWVCLALLAVFIVLISVL